MKRLITLNIMALGLLFGNQAIFGMEKKMDKIDQAISKKKDELGLVSISGRDYGRPFLYLYTNKNTLKPIAEITVNEFGAITLYKNETELTPAIKLLLSNLQKMQ